MPEISGLGRPPPSSDHQTDGPGPFGCKLQTSRSHHRQAHCFGDDRAKATEPKSLLAAFQDKLLLDRFDIDDPIWMKADLSKRRGEQVRASQAPDDLAFGASCDARDKQRCRRTSNRACSSSSEFVDRTICQAAAGKSPVDFANTERQDRFGTGDRPFEVLDAISKIGNDGVRRVLRHTEPLPKSGFHLAQKRICSLFVPYRNVSQCAYSGERSANCNLTNIA